MEEEDEQEKEHDQDQDQQVVSGSVTSAAYLLFYYPRHNMISICDTEICYQISAF